MRAAAVRRNHLLTITLTAATLVSTSCNNSPPTSATSPTGVDSAPGVKMPPSASAAAVIARARRIQATPQASAMRMPNRREPSAPHAMLAVSNAEARIVGTAIVAPSSTRKPTAIDVVFPMHAHESRALELPSGAALSLTLRDATDAPAEYANGYLVYRGGTRAGASVIVRPSDNGFEDYFLFDTKPNISRVEYDLTLPPAVAGLRLASNILELVGADGLPLAHASSPFLVDAAGKHTSAKMSLGGCVFDDSTQPTWKRRPTPPGATSCRVSISWDDSHVQYPALLDPTWESAAAMPATGSFYNNGTLLSRTPQQIVVFGFTQGTTILNTTLFFDVDSATWSVGPPTVVARAAATTVAFNNDNTNAGAKLFVSGGYAHASDGSFGPVASTEILSVDASGQWAWNAAAPMQAARYGHTATAIPKATGAQILLAGGLGVGPYANGCDAGAASSTAELYDTGTSSYVSPPPPNLPAPAFLATAKLSADRQAVLLVGGYNGQIDNPSRLCSGSTQLFAFRGGQWLTLPSMPSYRIAPRVVQLDDGRLLVAGGIGYTDATDQTCVSESDTQIFTYSAAAPYGSWSSGDPAPAGTDGGLVTLANGAVLLGPIGTGGTCSSPSTPTTQVDLFDPTTGHWSRTADTAQPHQGVTPIAVVKSSGEHEAVVFGGATAFDPTSGWTYTSTTEIFALSSSGQGCTVGAECATGICVGGLCQPPGLPITLDATALSNKGVSIPGVFGGAPIDTTQPRVLNLTAGTYNVQTVAGVASVGTFTVKSDGTIDYDPALEGLLVGRGGKTLKINGRTITVDATHLSQHTIEILANHFDNGASIGHVAFATSPARSFVLLPLLDFGYRVALDDNLPSDLAFNLDVNGKVHIAPASAYLASGENTTQLTIGGAHVSITIPAGLGATSVDGVALPAGQTIDLYLLPYSGGSPLTFQVGALTVGFTVDSAGDVIGDPELISVFQMHSDGGAFCSSIGTQGQSDGWQLDALGCRGLTVTDGTGDLVPPTPVTTPSARLSGRNRPPNQLPPFRKKAGGDPVLGDGEFTFQRVDTGFGGTGLHYQFARAYRSGLDNDGPLGSGWDHNYDQRILGLPKFDEWAPNFDPTTVGDLIGADCKGTVQVQDGTGNLQEFTDAGWSFVPNTQLPVERFVATTGDYLLEHMLVDAQSWRLTRPDGSVAIFDKAGFLLQTNDLAGNKISFSWDRATAPPYPDCTGLTPTICAAQRNEWKLNLMKDPIGQRRRLASVTDAVRTLYYVYDQKNPLLFNAVDRLKCVTGTKEDCTAISTILSFGYTADQLTSIARGPVGTPAFESYVYHAAASDPAYCLPSADIPNYCSKLCYPAAAGPACDNLNWDGQVRGKCAGLYCEPAKTCDLPDPDEIIGGRQPGALCCTHTGGGWDPLCLDYFFHGQDCFSGCETKYQCTDKRGSDNVSYAIYAGGVSRYLNNDITDVFDNSGKLVVHNEYGSDRAQVSFDRVTSQTLGSGTADNTIGFEYHDRIEETRNQSNDIYTTPNGPPAWPQPYSPSSALVNQYALPFGTILNLCPHHCVGSSCTAYDYDAPTQGTGDLAPFMANAVVIHDLHGRTRIQYLDGSFNVMREVAVDTGEVTDYSYQLNGMLMAVRQANGERTCLERNAQNRVTQSSVVPAAGLPGNPITQATVYQYDTKGQLITIVHDALASAWHTIYARDSLERVKELTEDVRVGAQIHTFYDYSGETPPVGVLVSPTRVTYPDKRYDTFSNFDAHMGGPQTTVIDAGSATPENRYTIYDNYGRVLEEGETGRLANHYIYGDSSDLWRLTRGGHRPDPSKAWVDTTISSHVVDGETVIDSLVEPLRTTKYTNVGRLASQKDLIATAAPAGTTLPATQTSCFNLSADGRVEAEIAPEGNGVVYQYGYTTSGTSVMSRRGYGVDASQSWAAGCRGHVAPLNDPGFSQWVSRTFKPGGFPDTEVDENGVQRKYTTDGLGRVLQVDTLDSGHAEPVPTQQFGYDTIGHRIWKATRVPGTAYGKPALPDATVLSYAEFDYDFKDRLTAERDFVLETGEQLAKSWVYDEVAGTVTLTDRGVATTTTYDGRGRVASTLLPDQSLQKVVHNLGADVTTVQSNSKGNVTRTYNYDTRGKLLNIVDANNVTLYQAGYDDDGNMLTETRAGLGPTTWKYDSFDRLVEEDKTVSTTPSTVIAVSKYGYDRNNRLNQYADAKNSGSTGIPWTMTFTGLDAPLTVTDTLKRQGSYVYATGPAWSRTLAATVNEPNGRVSSMAYDSQGRVTDVFSGPCGVDRNPWECSNSVVQLQRHLVYDARGFVGETDAPGRSTVQMTHDSLGRIVEDDVGTESTVHHSWADAGRTRVTQVKWIPTGSTATLTHRFDGMGRLHTVEKSGQSSPLATWDYGVGVGGPLSLAYSNGSKTSYTYDDKLRQTGLDVTFTPAGSTTGSPMYSMHEALGADSIVRLRQRRIGTLAPLTDGFEVDAAGRVTAENQNLASVTLPTREATNADADLAIQKTTTWSRYDIDTIGNITARHTRTQTLVHTVDNYSRLTALGGAAVGHDNIDDLTGKTGDTQFGFDAFKGTLMNATTKAGKGTYTYDALDRLRGEQQPKTAAQVFVWDGAQLVAHGAANSLTLDVPGNDVDQHVVSIDGFGSGSQWFYHQGPNQSVYAVSGSTGLVEAYAYSAFGELVTISNRLGKALPQSAFGNVFQWEGQLYDAATATYAMRARQYNPAWGRFLSPDPVSMRGGPSLYSFAGGGPLHSRDPFGLLSNDEKAIQQWIYEWMGSWDSSAGGGGHDILFGLPAQEQIQIAIATGGFVYRDLMTGDLHIQEYLGRFAGGNDVPQFDGTEGNGSVEIEGGRALNEPYQERYLDTILDEKALYAGMPVAGTPAPATSTSRGGGSNHTAERVLKSIARGGQKVAQTTTKIGIAVGLGLIGGGIIVGGGVATLGKALAALGAGALDGAGGGGGGDALKALGGGDDDSPLYGPYTHQLNNSGLATIAETQQMKSTTGRWGDDAVRATIFPFIPVPEDTRIMIEFYTMVAPDSIHPTNGTVKWNLDAGTFLPIILTGVSYPPW